MYNIKKWLDHIVANPNNFTMVTNPDGSITLTPAPGTIVQQGTPVNATNLNNLETGGFAAFESLMLLSQQVLQHKRTLADLEGESGQVNLTNSQAYPFNNSEITVNMTKARDTLNYKVTAEIVSATGLPGDIVISAKLLNGFKIKFTGSATAVTIKYYITGGMFQ